MALSQERRKEALSFLVDHHRDLLLRHRQELLVKISVLALRDSLLETLLEQTAIGLHAICGGQRSLLLRQRKDEPLAEYVEGRWQPLGFDPDGNRFLRNALAGLAARPGADCPDENAADPAEILVMPDDSVLLLQPLRAASCRLLALCVFIDQIPDEEQRCFLYALGRVLAAALRRQETEIVRRTELAHAGRLLLLGEMTSSLIHELNQPLAAIVNYAHGSQRQLETGAPPPMVLRERLDQIAKQACRAGDLVKRLRKLIRKEPVRRVAVDLTRLLANVIDLCETEANKHRIRLELRFLSKPLPQVCGDPLQIEQVLLNLLYNAIEAGPHPQLEHGVVAIEAKHQRSDRILVRIRDQGPGLPDGNTEQLFRSFHTTKPQGLGLGLAISRSLVENQGGRLWAENNSGYGAMFSLTLPIADTAVDAL
ncbi:MAG TPA: ATP-binding protein [Candidatus Competibacter sp.]|nr:ATP-binding protein [Candidatus Competibacter sp.]